MQISRIIVKLQKNTVMNHTQLNESFITLYIQIASHADHHRYEQQNHSIIPMSKAHVIHQAVFLTTNTTNKRE